VHVPDLHAVEPERIEAVVALDGARVLDAGCGEGRLTGFAAERAASVEQAQAAVDAGLVGFGVHGAEALDVERESFDVALCGWSL